MSILEMENVYYAYDKSAENVLKGIRGKFDIGKMYGITGKSGAGKTTLLSLLAGMEKCSGGRILYQGKDIKDLDCNAYRARCVGVVFQNHNLIHNATGLENILIAESVIGVRGKKARQKAYELMEEMGIEKSIADKKVMNLSGGQQQRIAIARAVCNNPDILIADEPTSSLDSDTTMVVMNMLRDLAHKQGKCVIVVSHSQPVVEMTDEIWGLTKGKLLFIDGQGT